MPAETWRKVTCRFTRICNKHPGIWWILFFFKSLFRFWLMAYSYQIIKQNQENEVSFSSLHNLIKLFYFTHAGGFKEVHSCEWEGSNQKRSITTFWRTMPFVRLGVDTCETNLQRSSISALFLAVRRNAGTVTTLFWLTAAFIQHMVHLIAQLVDALPIRSFSSVPELQCWYERIFLETRTHYISNSALSNAKVSNTWWVHHLSKKKLTRSNISIFCY